LKRVQKETGATLHVVTRYQEILKEVGSDGVYCPESEFGLSNTVRAALRACGKISPKDKLLFLAADQPRITQETVSKVMKVTLADCVESRAPLAACAWDGEVTGNPVIFSGLLADSLMQLTGDQGGKAVLRSCPERLEKVLCPGEEFWDIDLPDDLIRMNKHSELR